MASVGPEPAGPAKSVMDSGASASQDDVDKEERKPATDREASPSARLCSSLDVVPNGVECDSAKHWSPKRSSEMDGEEGKLWAKENGVSDPEPPHGSVVGSNGFILAKPQQQQQQGMNSSSVKPASPHRTNCLPSGSLRTGPSARAALGQATADTRNRPAWNPAIPDSNPALNPASTSGSASGSTSAPTAPAVTIHRARKTMSRPAVSPAQKLLNKELREAKSAKLERTKSSDLDSCSRQSPLENHLPQAPAHTPAASAQTPPSVSPAPPAAQPPPPPPTAKLFLGSCQGGLSARKKKRRMGTYSLVPKKKTKVLKQKSVLEMFQELHKAAKHPQAEEEVTVNGEKVDNGSEEEESEEMESDEEERLPLAEGPAQGGSCETFSQVEDEQESDGSGEDEGEDEEDEEEEDDEDEEEGTESDLSTESSLKKRLKKKATKADGALLRPSRKRKRRIKAKELEAVEQPLSSAPALMAEQKAFTQVDTHQPGGLSKVSPQDRDSASSAVEEAHELPLCSCRMETPKSREILTLADRKCMATESVDGQLTRCQGAILKHEMMRPSNSVQLLVLCEDHRSGMVKHQCCPGCGFFCRAGTFMECQPDVSISHRFHRGCASVLKGQSFCPHCGEEAAKAKEVTIAKADTTSTVPLGPPATAAGVLEGRADTTTGSSSQLLLGSEVSGRADSSLAARAANGPEASTAPAARAAESTEVPPVPPGPPRETLESILLALDTEKPKKLRFHPKQLYLSAKQGELKKVLLMLVDGIDPNFKMDSQSKRTPLHAAAEGGHKDICHVLVQAGANLDMCDDDHRTPLMEACENNHMETVLYLLRAGADARHRDAEGFTCLHLAAKSGHYNIVEHLLTTGLIDINCQDDGGWTAIIWATEYKHVDQVKLLLSKGADISIRDKEENICLHWAAFSGSADIAELLLNARCDLQAANIHGDSPLHIAARENRLDCVTLFLTRGADVFKKNREGETPPDCCSHNTKTWAALQANRRERDKNSGRSPEEKLLHSDIALGQERVPIPCVNSVDSQPYPDGFKYISENCVTSPMNIDRNITHLQYCVCKEDCSTSICMCGQLSLRCWYDKGGRLLPEFSREKPPLIFECNHACSCWRTCKNRVVQNGLRTRLQLFRTSKKGWGVRALQDIPQGSFVCEYVGEIVSEAEAEMRQNDAYLFSLDDKPQDLYCIDARFYGNVSRFLNHMCEPNLLACRVFTTHQDLRFPHVAFFASDNIAAGEELGFDYGDHFWEVKRKQLSCECGSARCRYSSAAVASLQADSTPEEQQQQQPSASPDTSSTSSPS